MSKYERIFNFKPCVHLAYFKKNKNPSPNMYKAKSGVISNSLYQQGGWGAPPKKKVAQNDVKQFWFWNF